MSPATGIGTLLKYLFGGRQAILDIAACPKAIWIGLLFVLSAGLAREYDGEDLLHEPWYALIPIPASLFTSLLLYWLARLIFPPRSISYRSFLGLYWLTAPLAWLYAIPFERSLRPEDAVAANLCLLAIVSFWRVLLMTRVVSIVFKCGDFAALFVVMFFADTVAMVIVWLTPLPIFEVMGGVRLTESEQTIQLVGFVVRLVSVLLWPILALATLIVGVKRRRKLRSANDSAPAATSEPIAAAPSETRRVGAALWIAAASSLLVWIGVLPATQAEQFNRRRVEKELRAGNLREAIKYMSQRERGDFPPHWDPPPRMGFGEQTPSLVDLQTTVLEGDVAEWVLELYQDKFRWTYAAVWITRLSDEQLSRFVEYVKRHPPDDEDAYGMAQEIYYALSDGRNQIEPPPPISDKRRATLEALLKSLGYEPPSEEERN